MEAKILKNRKYMMNIIILEKVSQRKQENFQLHLWKKEIKEILLNIEFNVNQDS